MSLQLLQPLQMTTFDAARKRQIESTSFYYERIHHAGRKDGPTKEELAQLRAEYIQAEDAAAGVAPSFGDFEAVATVRDALKRAGRGQAVRLCARVVSVSPPEVWGSDSHFRQGYVFGFEDDRGGALATPLVFDTTVVRIALEALQQGAPVEALGSLAVAPVGKKQRPLFAVHGVRHLESPLAAVAATPAEVRAAEELLLSLRGDTVDDLISNLVQELRRLHGVVADGLPVEFHLAEKATILQALSTGQLVGINPRLHTLVVGLPGAGKKILANYVRTLQPVALQAQASTLTRAGIAAGAQRSKDGLSAQAGLLPRAHLGAVVVEDLHGLRPTQRDQVFAVLAQVMEDGEVDLSNYARQHFCAQTALHFDLNRRSQLTADASLATCGPRALVADLGLRLDLLSRIDVIVELPSSSTSANDCALAMLGVQRRQRNESLARTLRVLVAHLRESHPNVDLGDVVDHMQNRLALLLSPLADMKTPDFDPAAFSRRMSNSMNKLVAAAARLKHRGTAVIVDVEMAVQLLKPKMAFIARLAMANPDLRDNVSRRAAIRRLFSGREFTPVEVMHALGIPRRTVMRDLDVIAEKSERGKYRIDGAADECATGTSAGEEAPGPKIGEHADETLTNNGKE